EKTAGETLSDRADRVARIDSNSSMGIQVPPHLISSSAPPAGVGEEPTKTANTGMGTPEIPIDMATQISTSMTSPGIIPPLKRRTRALAAAAVATTAVLLLVIYTRDTSREPARVVGASAESASAAPPPGPPQPPATETALPPEAVTMKEV